MQVNLIMQNNNENTLASQIIEAFENKPKKAYFFCGNLRDTGFKLIEEGMIDSKAKIYFAIGIDKKNTTRGMLEDILTYTKDVYYYSNNYIKEFNSNLCVFEFSKEAIIYSCGEKMSDTSMTEDFNIYTKSIFNLEDEKEAKLYKEQIKNLTKSIEKELFEKLTKAKIEELIEKKEIFTTRQYVHNVKSIAELLGQEQNKSNDEKSDSNDVVESTDSIEIPKIDLSDMDFDISDIDVSGVEESINEKQTEQKDIKSNKENNDTEEIEVENLSDMTDLADLAKLVDFNEEESKKEDVIDEKSEFYDETLKNMEFDANSTLDINDMLFSKADMKLDYTEEDDENEQVIEDEIVKVKKVNLNNITNFIYELPSKTTKGQDVSSLKIPNYIQTMIPEFFELVDNSKNIEIDGVNYKVRDIKLEIVDVKENNKYTDRNAKIMHKLGQSYITFNADCIKDILFEESDIARVIKLASDVYHIEVISKDMQEYKLWHKLCNKTFKSSTRKYGMM